MNFIKGQKVECVEDVPKTWSIIKGGVYEISYIDTNGNIQVNRQMYKKERFKTIIQSIDDVVVGMELTHKEYGECEVLTKTIKYIGIFTGFQSLLCVLNEFKEYKPKEEIMQKEETKYEVAKPFTISDLWDAFEKEHSCPEFQREWGKLLGEGFNTKRKFKDMYELYGSKSLNNNLHHLEKKGLIKKIEEDIVLKTKMTLRDEWGMFGT